MDVTVEGTDAPRQVVQLALGDSLLIGRSAECDVVVGEDRALSRKAVALHLLRDSTVAVACHQSFGYTEISRDGRQVAVLAQAESRTIRASGAYTITVHNPGPILSVGFQVPAYDTLHPAPAFRPSAADPGTVGGDLRWTARYIVSSPDAERWIAAAAMCGLLVRQAKGSAREYYTEFHGAWEAWCGRRMRRGNSVSYPIDRALQELGAASHGNKVEDLGRTVLDLGLISPADFGALEAELLVRRLGLEAQDRRGAAAPDGDSR